MKKVAFLTNSMGGGGAERIVANLGEHFSQDGDLHSEVVLFERNDFYKPHEGVQINYLADFRGKEHPILKLLSLPLIAWRLRSYVRKNNIDVVQSHLYRANYVNIMAQMMGGTHESQIVNHDNFFRGYRKTFFGRQKLKLVDFFYKRADKIIAISEDMREGMEELLGRRVEKINNPYDIEMMEAKGMEEVTELPKGRRYIISVGSLIPLKRGEDVIEGYSKIANRYPDYDLVILGDGSERKNLEELTKILGLEGRVHFLGRVENPFKYLKRSEIFVMASESEGFPNVLIEAMACGCQVVASDCISGPREIINPDLHRRVDKLTSGGYGSLFPVGDVEALGQGLESAIKGQAKYQVSRRAGDFQREIIMKRYKEVLLNG
ncbi:N-acetylgalactosamine-N,N'-diacetylbacillosaminyl-diphospho-undecaprenol 4-alpha-N-acetylgalactosaminyltransferase [Propionigenium maris DSM 9537]|uniref:N-acetylgalactosamine-N, N'-diacetylbacillosaminyl-diphospho-undecaprenol 4-alpha-N-acetylgalactosaminyltransferase n=1 Tax=Propionigenium maris DSM 9537 TaxID=1123000 RepID=A0A9W6GJU3_9FUSO|nr:glycosyltransferase [Propionigenium maris]GLI55151.1 N-acetylgalactosamine-N,N'-diacetylbacillosaminyl-diphospho-undecaprenol 4-alpha-N-acetylgalactosaminyltransferase [Propionigenium maris DSM 9537]